MGTRVQQQPDDMHGRGRRYSKEVPGSRDKSQDDPDWAEQLYTGGGYGIHAYAVAAAETRRARTRGWTANADGFEGAESASHGGATTFEQADIAGGAGVDRASGDI